MRNDSPATIITFTYVTNLLGKKIGIRRRMSDGRAVFVSNKQIDEEFAASEATRLAEETRQREEALAVAYRIKGYREGLEAAKNAAGIIDPEILAKAASTGNKGLEDLQKGQAQIDAGEARKARGQRELEAAKLFGF
jgi:ribosomal protein S11